MQTKTKTKTTAPQMPAHQARAVRRMDSGAVMDFQLRLQIECDMSHAEAAEYVAQAFPSV